MPDIIMCDKPAANKITGSYAEVYMDTVEAGENTVANVTQIASYLATLLPSGRYVVAANRVNSESPAPASDEFGMCNIRYGASGSATAVFTTKRYHNGAWASSNWGTNYTLAVTPGSKIQVVSIKAVAWP